MVVTLYYNIMLVRVENLIETKKTKRNDPLKLNREPQPEKN